MIKLTRNLARLACLAVATVAVMGFAPSANAETTIYSSTGEELATGEVVVCLPGDANCAQVQPPTCQAPNKDPKACTGCKYQQQCLTCCQDFSSPNKPALSCIQQCNMPPAKGDSAGCFYPKQGDGNPGLFCRDTCEEGRDCAYCCISYEDPSIEQGCLAACGNRWTKFDPDFVIVVD